MFNVSDYLKKFVRIENDNKQTSDSIRVVFAEVFNPDIATKLNFDFKKGIIHIKGDSNLKSMVFMKKTSLLEKFSKNYPNLKVTDIR